MIFTVAGSIGLLGLTILLVSATKAIMNYYERLRLKGSHRWSAVDTFLELKYLSKIETKMTCLFLIILI